MLNRINRDIKSLLGFKPLSTQPLKGEVAYDPTSFNKALLAEFYRTALSVVTMASLCNALARGRQLQHFGTVTVYMPPDPTLYIAVEKQLLFAEIDDDLLAELKHFYQEVRLAVAHTNLAIAKFSPAGPTRAADWKNLCWDWQSACGAMRTALTPILVTAVDPVFKNRIEYLADTAKDAQDGGTPSISADGVVIVPGVLDRRASERVRKGLPIWLETVSGRQRVTLQDISEGGMGLAFCRDMEIGMTAVAQLACGRRLHGFVVWVQGNRAGLRFATPLAVADPLLVPRS